MSGQTFIVKIENIGFNADKKPVFSPDQIREILFESDLMENNTIEVWEDDKD